MRVVPLYSRKSSLTSKQFSFVNSTGVMNIQEYVKYLLCLLVITITSSVSPTSLVEATRVQRGVLDWLSSLFRPCRGCLCGRSNRNTAKFIGGETTYSHEFPWLVNIYSKTGNQVSGALINDRYVLTAASQIIDTAAHEIKVSLGTHDRCNVDISSVNSSVDTIITYPEYVGETHAHDLALIKLSRPINLEKRIAPVCMPNPNSTYLGQVGTFAGWTEASNSEKSFVCLPRKIGLPILSGRECIKSGVEASYFHDDSGCIGVLGSKSIVCTNDVGTPIHYRSYTGVYDLIGILSDGNICGETATKTAVFTRLGPHLHWILQNTKDACYCSK